MKDISKLSFIEVAIQDNLNSAEIANCINLTSKKLESRYISINPNNKNKVIFTHLTLKELKKEFVKIKEIAKDLSDKGYSVIQIVSIINSQYASYQ